MDSMNRAKDSMIPSISGWMDPAGEIYEMAGTAKHWAWIMENMSMLWTKYGLELSNDKSAVQDLLNAGWVRIFVSSDGSEVSLQARSFTASQLRAIKRELRREQPEQVYLDYKSQYGLLRCGAMPWRQFLGAAEQEVIDDAQQSYADRMVKLHGLQERL